ncbi:MalY/PatB family protein [Vibrio sp. SCSIO 43136]|uniref:MalY/PatB family protein n=1 Tax=Vibrio sp. SCSIO 43136 TaxID=2819101 RepID=UPI0020754A54|nr:MalY/PatB family protein [Vibrio sp. SCSIO 43136]USD68006.1 pyridoxal phosphate-dependent aminotransferase [Vibrio sp. SCSIO 43136]
MANYNFTRPLERNDSTSIKTNQTVIKQVLGLNYYPDTIPMWVADMDFECAPAIVEALSKRAAQGNFGYSYLSDEYFESVINWYGRRHDMNIDKQWLVFSNGTVSAIRNVVRAFTEQGDGVIIQPPVYYPFEMQIKETGREVVRNHLLKDKDNHYRIDLDDFERQCKDPKNKLFIYCNPHNPTGNIWSREVTQELLRLCHENGVMVFSDEIHADLIRQGESFTSALNLKFSDNVIVATAVNKTFNVAGLHITNLVIKNKTVRKTLNNFTGWIGVSPFAVDATIAAFNQEEAWVEEVNQVITHNMAYMEQYLGTHLPKVKFFVPQATYLAWLDFSAFGMEEKELLNKIADQAHLILEGGSMFGEHGKGFIRINVACPTSILEEALHRLVHALGD